MLRSVCGILTVALAACAARPSTHDRVMNEIEAAIVLPAGADNFGKYARYYASADPDDIIAVYIKPAVLLRREREQCEQLEEDGQSHRAPCSPIAREGAPSLVAGGRYWMKDWTNLPHIGDPDCGTVAFVFHRSTKRFTEKRCFGAASDPYIIID